MRVSIKNLPRPYLNTVQAAAVLGVSSRTVRYWIEKGILPAVVHKQAVGGTVKYRYLIPTEAVIALFERRKLEAVRKGYLPAVVMRPYPYTNQNLARKFGIGKDVILKLMGG